MVANRRLKQFLRRDLAIRFTQMGFSPRLATDPERVIASWDAQNSSECVHLDALEKFIHMQIIPKCKVHAFLIDI